MMTLGLRLSSQTPFHADADDSELFLKTLAVSDWRFHACTRAVKSFLDLHAIAD